MSMHTLDFATDDLSLFLTEVSMSEDGESAACRVSNTVVHIPTHPNDRRGAFVLLQELLQASETQPQRSSVVIAAINPVTLAKMKHNVERWRVQAHTWFVSADVAVREDFLAVLNSSLGFGDGERIFNMRVIVDNQATPVLPPATVHLLPEPQLLGAYAHRDGKYAISIGNAALVTATLI